MMNDNPTISLIVPFYNMGKLCDRFFESLKNQTYTNIQLIIVDDGSTDDSKEKIFSYKDVLEKRGYIFEYYYQNNKGLGGAINTGLKKIKGEYFCWADPDDYYEDDAFEVRVEYLTQHPSCAVLTCGGYVLQNGERSPIIYPKHHFKVKQFDLFLDYESIFFPGCHLISTKCFDAVNPKRDIYEARRGQDWQLLLPVYYSYERDVLDVPVYNYVIYQDSMSHSYTSYEKKLGQIEESETIQIETIKRIAMPQAEKERYTKHIRAFHAKLKMYNARTYKRKEEFDRFLGETIKCGEMDYKDYLRIVRFKLMGY